MVEPTLLIAAASVFLAATVQGTTGFGFAMIATPIITLFIEPQLVVPMVVINSGALNIVILCHARRWMNLRRVWVLILTGALTTPLGAYLLVVVDASILKLGIGMIVMATAGAMLAGFNRSFGRERLASAPVGAVSGVLNAATGMAGPPVVLFFANQKVDPREFRANIVAHFLILTLATTPSFIVGGLLTRSAVQFSIALLPASLAGVLVGVALAGRVPRALFLQIALGVTLLAGLASAVNGFLG